MKLKYSISDLYNTDVEYSVDAPDNQTFQYGDDIILSKQNKLIVKELMILWQTAVYNIILPSSISIPRQNNLMYSLLRQSVSHCKTKKPF